jgi:hypothetical protein
MKIKIILFQLIVLLIVGCSFSDSQPTSFDPTQPNSGSATDGGNTSPSERFAEAGENQAVLPGAQVTLSAAGSNPLSDITGFAWSIASIVSGDANAASALTLSGQDSQTLTFTAPGAQSLTETTIVRFQLVVTFGNLGQAVDTVDVTLTIGSLAVSAGSDQLGVVSDQVVNLNGSVTSSGNVRNVQWIQVGGSINVPLTGNTTTSASFTAPWMAPSANVLTFRMIANDDQGNTGSDDVSVLVTNNRPNANAGKDLLVLRGSSVSLDGSASRTIDGQSLPSLQWVQLSGNNTVALSSTSAASPQFIAPAVTGDRDTLVFQLTASQDGKTSTDQVTVTVVSELTYNDFGGRFYGIDVDSSQNRAYVATGEGGLGIFDLTNPSAPELLGVFNTPGNTQDLVKSGPLVYLIDRSNGLYIVDPSSPSASVQVGHVDTPGLPSDIELSGDYAFIAEDFTGIAIVNISDPQAPVLERNFDTPHQALGIDVSADGKTAYVADDRTGLLILDITNPAAPVLQATLDTVGRCNSVVVSGNIAYLADGDAGLQVVDVTNPQNPTILQTLDTPGFATKVKLEGGLLFLADGSSGVIAYSLLTPAAPALLGSFNTSGSAEDVAVLGGSLLVADGEGGLQVTDLGNPSAIVLRGTYPTIGRAFGIAIKDNYAFVADYYNGLFILDIGNPLNPRLVSNLGLSGKTQDIVVQGNYAYTTEDTVGINVIDISDVQNPAIVGHTVVQGFHAKRIVVNGQNAYVAAEFGGLATVDISNPASPVFLDSNTFGPGGSQSKDVVLQGNYAYVANGDQSFAISNISNPESITNEAILKDEFSQIPLGDGHQIEVSGIYAFLAHNARDLAIINVQNPTNPFIFKEIVIDGTRKTVNSVFIVGDVLFATNSNVDSPDRGSDDLLWIWDITDPTSLTNVPDGEFSIGGRYSAQAIFGNFMVLAGEAVKIIDISDPFNPTR